MSNRWLWRPVAVGAAVLGVLSFLFATYMVLVLEEGHPPAIAYINDLIHLALPFSAASAAIGAAIGALFAVIRKWIRKKKAGARQTQ